MRDRSIADLHAALSWDLDDFNRGTSEIDVGFRALLDRAQTLGERFRSVGKEMTKFFTLPIAAGAGGLAALAKGQADELKAMGNAARLAGEDFERFQKQAHAARDVGVEFQQLGDIFKDTREKIGDFVATGQGEMADFFEKVAPKVGVTAEMFRNLSGKDALQLYYNSLMQANVSQEEMVFYMESLANEATALAPLLAANGAEFRRLGEQANVFTPEQVASLLEYREAMKEIGFAMQRLIIAAVDSGLIDMLTRLVKGFAEWVSKLAETNPGLIRFAGIVALVVAAIGPIVSVLTALAMVILPLFLARLSPVFFVLSALINPIGTAAVMLGKLVGGFTSISGVLGGTLGLFGRLLTLVLRLHPVTAALSAIFLLFGDNISAALGRVWEKAKEALGPAFERMFEQAARLIKDVKAAFEELAASPIGQFIGAVIDMLGLLIEALVEVAGTAVVFAIETLVNLLTTIVDVGRDMVRIISLLLRGEWSAAWDAAGNAVTNAIANMLPSFKRLYGWIEDAMVRLGLLEESQRRIASASAIDQIGQKSVDQIIADSGLESNGPRAGPAYSLPPSGGSGGGGSNVKTGPTAEELAARREELEFEHELQMAREAGDEERIRALEYQRDLKDRIADYEDAGLKNADAQIKAEQELAELEIVRRDAMLESLVADNLRDQLQEARIRGDHAAIRSLEQELFIEEEIADLTQRGLDIAQAEAVATDKLLRLEQARADAIAKRVEDQELSRKIELARLRGDSPDQIRRLEEEQRRNKRIEELQRDEDLSRGEAEEIAIREGSDRARAHLQGNFREAFRGGLQAALDGDLKGFFQGWIEDASFNALAKVLDNLADRLANLVFGSSEGEGGGGGILGSLGQIIGIGGVIGGGGGDIGSGGAIGSADPDAFFKPVNLPGFNTEGSFKINGLAGVDRNILSLNGTPVAKVSQGEIMDVRKGRPGGGGGASEVVVTMDPSTATLGAFVRSESGKVVASAAPMMVQGGANVAQQNMTRRQSRRVG